MKKAVEEIRKIIMETAKVEADTAKTLIEADTLDVQNGMVGMPQIVGNSASQPQQQSVASQSPQQPPSPFQG